MLNYLEDVKDYDTLWFMPIEDEEDSIHIASNTYKEAGEPIGGSPIGPSWHIVLFKTEENNFDKLDHFEAVLSDPREYISSLIPQGWYGLIARKTTTSDKFIENVIARFKEV